MKKKRLHPIVKFILAGLLLIVATLLFTIKNNLTGTGTKERYKGTSMLGDVLITESGEKYEVDKYFFKQKVKVNGYVVGFSNFGPYGFIPKLKITSFQVLDTKNSIEGYLKISQSGKLIIEHEVYREPGNVLKARVVLKGIDVEKLKWSIEEYLRRAEQKKIPLESGAMQI